MSQELELVKQFYTAFQNKDAVFMASCYHSDASFQDEVFTLQGEDVGHMWAMLCARGKDMTLTFRDISVNANGQITCHWEPIYTFSGTGRKVHNRIDTIMEFKEGKIIKQKDTFSFYSWASQALGLPGMLLGWTPFLRAKVRATANKSLDVYKKEFQTL